MPKDATCPICESQFSRQSISKHIFSKTHACDIDTAIIRGRRTIEPWIAEYDAGKKHLAHALPSLSFTDGSNQFRYRICLGCKDIAASHLPRQEHVCNAEGRKATIDYYKDVLANTEKERMYRFSRVKEVQTDACVGGGGGEATQEEVEGLQRKIARLERVAAINQKIVEEADECADGLYAVLGHLHEHNLDVLIGAMKVLREHHETIYDRQVRNFGSIWDEKLMEE